MKQAMKQTVIVEETSMAGCAEAQRTFRVIRVKSALDPRVGDTLNAADISRLIVERQVEVFIDLPRKIR
jgi:hypothetical protein